MAQYTKFNSNYIKRTTHQTLGNGDVIYERDWVTLGNKLNFGPNKKVYYTDGNFIFTTSRLPNYQKRHKIGVTVGEWTYDMVKDSKENLNKIIDDEHINDVRAFAYYGSAVELVRASIENIINTFPGNIKPSELYSEERNPNMYVVQNDFKVDFLIKRLPDEYANALRYMRISSNSYTLNGKEVTSYDIVDRKLYAFSTQQCNHVYTYLQFFTEEEREDALSQGWVEVSMSCLPSTYLPYTTFYNDCSGNDELISQAFGSDMNNPIFSVKIGNGEDEITIDAYKYEGEMYYVSSTGDDWVLQPKDDIIEEYFNTLTGLEKQLLYRKSTPIYTNYFITPIQGELTYEYVRRKYTWPSDGYCIRINTYAYEEYVKSLADMAQTLDEMWCDNLYSRMTHEAIKNYDWTYTREYVEGEEEEYVAGGNRMADTLHLVGNIFDNIKLKIDTMKRLNRVTLDGEMNMPSSLMTDKLELLGWDIFSTIPVIGGEDMNLTKLDDFSFVEGKKETNFLNSTNDYYWYPQSDSTQYTFSTVNNTFMRKLILFSKDIFSTKGTMQSIDKVMALFGYGENDYSVTEEYYVTKPLNLNEILTSSEGEEETLRDRIVRINTDKYGSSYYDSDIDGLPIKEFAIPKLVRRIDDTYEVDYENYIIPFCDSKKYYDENLYFQSKGGWGYDIDKQVGTELNKYAWAETIPYLHVVATINNLLDFNPNAINEGDVFYVTDVKGYFDESETPNENLSHFFVVVDEYFTDKLSGWRSVDMSDGSTDEYYEKAKYLDNMFTTSIGNNPHGGYGNYDLGQDFIESITTPFKRAIDANKLPYDDVEDAEAINFEMDGPNVVEDKITSEMTTDDSKVKIFADEKLEVIVNCKDDYQQANDGASLCHYASYDIDSIREMEKEIYYINSKVLVFENKIDNEYYKGYFKDVIMNYLTQVIPSTTILIFKGID